LESSSKFAHNRVSRRWRKQKCRQASAGFTFGVLWCLSFLKPYRWHVAAFIACGLVVSAVQLAIPRAIQTLIDEIIPSRRFDLFAWLLTGIAAALVVMFLAEAASNLMERTVREYASRDLTLAVFDQLRRLGFSYFERTAVGETL